MYFFNCFVVLLITLSLQCVTSQEPKKLRGVTIMSPPFVMKTEHNHFEGFAIDLIAAVSKLANFTYELYETPDGKYGAPDSHGRPSGIINELNLRRADFSIADLTKSEMRDRFIDFSEPFMTLDLTALIHKRNVGNMTSFEDLINQNNITYGTLREGETYRFMSMSADRTIVAINRYIYSNSYNLVNSRREGIDRALNSNYAFIQESVANEYAMDLNCELTVIDDKHEYYPREYAIGLQKMSPLKQGIDQAIRQLKKDGTMDRLMAKYWRTKCLSNSVIRLDAITSLSLILSALLTYIIFK